MNHPKPNVADVYARLGYKPLNRTWAKIEIVLSLIATGLGLLVGDWAVTRPTADLEWGFAVAALALFVLGAYLAMAGHRSHLYQSNNELTALLIEETRCLRDKADTP
jgi:hypothetical protein